MPSCPVLHAHCVAAVQPTHDSPEPAAQATQLDAPAAAPYVPAAQFVHAPAFVVVEYFPAGQLWHPPELYWPATHCPATAATSAASAASRIVHRTLANMHAARAC